MPATRDKERLRGQHRRQDPAYRETQRSNMQDRRQAQASGEPAVCARHTVCSAAMS